MREGEYLEYSNSLFIEQRLTPEGINCRDTIALENRNIIKSSEA